MNTLKIALQICETFTVLHWIKDAIFWGNKLVSLTSILKIIHLVKY